MRIATDKTGAALVSFYLLIIAVLCHIVVIDSTIRSWSISFSSFLSWDGTITLALDLIAILAR